MKTKKILSLVLTLCMAFSLCGGTIGVVTPKNVNAAAKIKLSATKKTLTVGKSFTLKVKGTTKKAKWTSSNKKIATVTATGKVTAKKAGTATITAKAAGKKLTCKITVKGGGSTGGDKPSTGSDFEYKEENGGITIIKYNGKGGSVSIPKEIDGKQVKAIGNGAFSRCEMLKEIDIPDGVTSIGDKAFTMCTSLEKVNLPDSVEKIGEDAFGQCPMKTIKLPANLKKIEYQTFQISGLTSIVIPDGVEEIANYAFGDSHNLESVTIPASVKKIGRYAFKSTAIKQVTLPAGVKVPIPSDSLGLVDDYGYRSGNFSMYYSDDPFNDCSGIKITYMGKVYSTREEKEELSSLIYTWDGKTEDNNTEDKDKDKAQGDHKYPVEPVSSFKYEDDGNGGIRITKFTLGDDTKDFCIPDTIDGKPVRELGNNSFSFLGGFEAMEIPDSVEIIGEYTFSDGEIPKIIIGKNVTKIGKCAFAFSEVLEIEIPDSVKSVGENAFLSVKKVTYKGVVYETKEDIAKIYDIINGQ